jgi:hypothetical protein
MRPTCSSHRTSLAGSI